MKRKLFALLVGINEYAGPVSPLLGGYNDVCHVAAFLEQYYSRYELNVEELIDSEAERKAIINNFRNHLCCATENDIVLFYFSGHGSRQIAAPELYQYYPEKVHETLVCYDSRTQGGLDLADKELSILIAEVAQHNPHITIILDTCHSGSGTRTREQYSAKSVHELDSSRHLEDYLDGYFLRNNTPVEGKHILLAACSKWDVSYTRESSIFTDAMLDVLKRNQLNINYNDLIARTKASRKMVKAGQEPQLNTIGGFNIYSRFLDGKPLENTRIYRVCWQAAPEGAGYWELSCGALHGLHMEASKEITLSLYPAETTNFTEQEQICDGRVERINAHYSKISFLNYLPEKQSSYWAKIKNSGTIRLLVDVSGDEEGIKLLQAEASLFPDLELVFYGDTQYQISCKNGRYLSVNTFTGSLVAGYTGYEKENARAILDNIKQIEYWQRMIPLRNNGTEISDEYYDLIFEAGRNFTHRYIWKNDTAPILHLQFLYQKNDDEWQSIPFRINIRNKSRQHLQCSLIYFSPEIEIMEEYNGCFEDTGMQSTIYPRDGNGDSLLLPDGWYEATDTFKLLVSSEAIDGFIITQPGIKPLGMRCTSFERGADGSSEKEKKHTIRNDWTAKTISLTTIRQLGVIGRKKMIIEAASLEIKKHPQLRAGICLRLFNHVLSRKGSRPPCPALPDDYQLVNLIPVDTFPASILELVNIINQDSLAAKPLQVVFNYTLNKLQVLVFDGLTGIWININAPVKKKKNMTIITIPKLYVAIEERNGSGCKVAKMCFIQSSGTER